MEKRRLLRLENLAWKSLHVIFLQKMGSTGPIMSPNPSRTCRALLTRFLHRRLALYGASKAAVTTAGETLRLELEPFGVRVVTVHAGVIKTRFEENMAEFYLPSSSRYSPIQKDVEGDAMNKNFPPGMDSTKFADYVAKDVIAGKNGKIWYGTMSAMVRYAHWMVPTSIFDYMLAQTSGLGKLAKMVRERKT